MYLIPKLKLAYGTGVGHNAVAMLMHRTERLIKPCERSSP